MTNNNQPQIKPLEWKYSYFPGRGGRAAINGYSKWTAEPIPDMLEYMIGKHDKRDKYSLFINGKFFRTEINLGHAEKMIQADFEEKIKSYLIEESQS